MQSCKSLPHAVALAHLSADDLGSGCTQLSQLRRGRRASASRLHCFKPNPFDVRSWKRGNALPGVVEAILLEELLNAAPKALADEGVAAPNQAILNSYDIQETIANGMFGLCALLTVVLVVGLGSMFIQDFSQNRKMEERKKKRERAKKEEMTNGAALLVSKKTGSKKTPTGPAGFGQVSR